MTAKKENEPQQNNQTQTILEKYFEALIEGQANYEQFVAEVKKDADAGAKKIDQAILNQKQFSNHHRINTNPNFNTP